MKVKPLKIHEDIDKAIEYASKSEKLEKTQSLLKLTEWDWMSPGLYTMLWWRNKGN